MGVTTLVYQDSGGLVRWLGKRVYDNGDEVEYTHDPDGKLQTRVWKRASGDVTTTYGYHPGTRALYTVDYLDTAESPDVEFRSYTRAGLREEILDAVGSRVFTYNADLSLDQEKINLGGGGLYGKVITRTYADSGMVGRPTGFEIGPDLDHPDQDYETTYAYDTKGRLEVSVR